MTKPLLINDIAPDFEAETQLGPIKFSEYAKGSWVIFFSHPRDFTPVCTTELARAAQLQDEFARRGVKMLAISCDDVDSHKSWVADVSAYGKAEVKYPIVADPERKIAKLYHMLPAEAPGHDAMPFTVRSVLIMDDTRRIRAMVTYPAPIGRNFDELLRVVDALQVSDRLHCATPVDWKPGAKVIVPSSVPDDVVGKNFANGLEVVDLPSKKAYLRYGTHHAS
ncbi:Peroxiredoxin-6 [Cyanidiococcus yangmingshanensis]|uniref:Peroxiredoxin-6 n=1 Tax=Cyanidiococcus yangmingshanensis TaxID=2690220 RepID=A0A7J7IGW1_9RHOD|nr:Peroxiredoxin-6 [Cyanidiococcus yangmingshanensis]